MKTITPQVLNASLKDYLLIDVRRPVEFEICRIEGAINIPLESLSDRFSEINVGLPVVTICHHGVRSLTAAKSLENMGLKNVLSLTGGVAAWAMQIDPTMKKY
jgi:rhodanese-related sulfurtransferase